MAATTILTATAAASALFAAVGARKVYSSITAERGLVLPSLRALSSQESSSSAYPEDYYPGGGYAELTFGETHYFMFGPEEGKKVVFVHGLSTPASVWSKVARHMATSGCRVLLYDLYSRGYSVGPPVDHDPLLYVSQLDDLLRHVGWNKANFVGLSLPSEIPWVGKIFLMPYSEEIFAHKAIKGYFSTKNVESMKVEFKDEKEVPACVEEAAAILTLQFKHHAGYARGVMSTLKTFPLTALTKEYSTSREQAYPVQLVWGTRDTVVPGSTVGVLQKLIPRVKVTRVAGATHSIVMTHADAVIKQLKPFVI
ncbi:hypothetical protein BG006_008718 [Podila minutissima]|uniref:AB hydrolase-1 domain-containing protein n=1 Tax=Podila minutissima TaxID=64525 RepID=A0A9P5SR05_9FUNG|nr:hypothetical protein BG006_008718 [Podila minutissima]